MNQYKVKGKSTVRDAGGDILFYAWEGDKVNSRPIEDAGDYYGTVYTISNDFRGRGWIAKNALDWIRCW